MKPISRYLTQHQHLAFFLCMVFFFFFTSAIKSHKACIIPSDLGWRETAMDPMMTATMLIYRQRGQGFQILNFILFLPFWCMKS